MARATTTPGKRNQESIFLDSERLPPKRHGPGGELGEFGRQLGKMVEETVVAIHVEPVEAWRPKPATNPVPLRCKICLFSRGFGFFPQT